MNDDEGAVARKREALERQFQQVRRELMALESLLRSASTAERRTYLAIDVAIRQDELQLLRDRLAALG